MTKTFEPPVSDDVPPVYDGVDPYRPVPVQGQRLMRFFKKRAVGRSILKMHDGTYRLVSYPSTTDIAAAAAFYEGGHVYRISDAEATALTAAGYGSGVTAADAETWNDGDAAWNDGSVWLGSV